MEAWRHSSSILLTGCVLPRRSPTTSLGLPSGSRRATRAVCWRGGGCVAEAVCVSAAGLLGYQMQRMMFGNPSYLGEYCTDDTAHSPRGGRGAPCSRPIGRTGDRSGLALVDCLADRSGDSFVLVPGSALQIHRPQGAPIAWWRVLERLPQARRQTPQGLYR